MENELSKNEQPCTIDSVSISFIHKLIDKYEDKIKCIENLQKQPKDRNYPRWQEERLKARLYERKTFLEDLKSLLNEC